MFAESRSSSWGTGPSELPWLGAKKGLRDATPDRGPAGEMVSLPLSWGVWCTDWVLRVQRQDRRGTGGWQEGQRPRSSSALWYERDEGIVQRPSHSSSTLRGPLAPRLCRQRISSTWRSSTRTLASSWAPEARLPVSRLNKA